MRLNSTIKIMKRLSTLPLLLIIALLFLQSGCTVERHGYEYPPSYVTIYLFADNIKTCKSDIDGISFRFEGRRVSVGEEFDELAKYYGDTSFNGHRLEASYCRALSSCISDMKIETIDNFDASHPAGSDVSELVNCYFYSYMRFIRNNYVADYPFVDIPFPNESVEREAEMCKVKVSDIGCDSTILSNPYNWNLIFDKKPDQPGSYRFKLTVITDGKELTTTFDISF